MFHSEKLKEIVGEPPLRGLVKEHAPFSLASLVAWLEKQNPEAGYCFSDWKTCLWGEYTKAHDGTMDYHYYTIGGKQLPNGIELSSMWQGSIAVTSPNTFGAALTRARAALAGK